MNEDSTECLHSSPSLEPPTVARFPGLGSHCIDAERGVKESRNSRPELRPAGLSRTLHRCSCEPKSPGDVGAGLPLPRCTKKECQGLGGRCSRGVPGECLHILKSQLATHSLKMMVLIQAKGEVSGIILRALQTGVGGTRAGHLESL